MRHPRFRRRSSVLNRIWSLVPLGRFFFQLLLRVSRHRFPCYNNCSENRVISAVPAMSLLLVSLKNCLGHHLIACVHELYRPYEIDAHFGINILGSFPNSFMTFPFRVSFAIAWIVVD